MEAEAIAKRWGSSIGFVIPKEVVEKEKIIEVENVKEFFTTIPLTAKIIGGILIFFMLLRMF